MRPLTIKFVGGKKRQKKTGECVHKRRNKYSPEALKNAIEKVLVEKWSIYKASKHFSIPWSTLKDNVMCSEGDNDTVNIRKMGRPFALTTDSEIKLVNFIIGMQERGFGVTVNRVRHLAYAIAEKQYRDSDKAFPFSNVQKSASWKWWRDFRQRYNLCLRTPENLSNYRAANTNRETLDDFYDKLEDVYNKVGTALKPSQIWNCDETGVCYVMKSGRVVTRVGKKYVYNRVIADKAETHTVLPCVNAAGEFGPGLIIFKGVRMIDGLKEGALPNFSVGLSPSGWINSELFLRWFKMFAEGCTSEKPVILIMDSHASHFTPEVMEIAAQNEVIIVALPSHTSHILQPLDISVYRPLKVAWNAALKQFQEGNPFRRPGRFDFHSMFSPAFLKAFSRDTIISGFTKSGIFPLNRQAVQDEALTTAPTGLNESQGSTCSSANEPRSNEEDTPSPKSPDSKLAQQSLDDLLRLPDLRFTSPQNKKPAQKKKKDQRAKVYFNPTPEHQDVTTSATMSSIQLTPEPSGSKTMKKMTKKQPKELKSRSKLVKQSDDICVTCKEEYALGKNKSPWIQCCFCLKWFHENCQSIDSATPPTVFMCNLCAGSDSADSNSE